MNGCDSRTGLVDGGCHDDFCGESRSCITSARTHRSASSCRMCRQRTPPPPCGLGDRRRTRPAVLVPPRLPTSHGVATAHRPPQQVRSGVGHGCTVAYTSSRAAGWTGCARRRSIATTSRPRGSRLGRTCRAMDRRDDGDACRRCCDPDLLGAHAAAGIELRFAPTLWPAHDLAVSDDWDFSIVRMTNAQPRS